METHTFRTKVMKNGIIQVPKFAQYENQEVEISIVLKPQTNQPKPKKSIKAFFEQWTGFFDTVSIEDERYQALMKKHS